MHFFVTLIIKRCVSELAARGMRSMILLFTYWNGEVNRWQCIMVMLQSAEVQESAGKLKAQSLEEEVSAFELLYCCTLVILKEISFYAFILLMGVNNSRQKNVALWMYFILLFLVARNAIKVAAKREATVQTGMYTFLVNLSFCFYFKQISFIKKQCILVNCR